MKRYVLAIMVLASYGFCGEINNPPNYTLSDVLSNGNDGGGSGIENVNINANSITNGVDSLGSINGAYTWDLSDNFVAEGIMTAASTVTVSSLPVGQSATMELYVNGDTNISFVGAIPVTGFYLVDAKTNILALQRFDSSTYVSAIDVP